jgi:putative CocE/NonD family hydrolase
MARSRSTKRARNTIPPGSTFSSWVPGVTAAGTCPRGTSSETSTSECRRRATSERRSRRGWYTWLTEDQRFVANRPDVLSWQTESLAEDVEIAGDVVANLEIATTGSDLDVIVKLIDVYPEEVGADPKMGGYQFMVSSEVLRGRFARSFERPQPIVPNAVTRFRYSLRTQNYRFKKGHRIMAQVQSTWFPLIDRNPQTFVPNIFDAKASDFKSATVKVYRSASAASRVEVPIVQRILP